MGFVRCPGCGSQNRDTDAKCYNCEGDLAELQAGAEVATAVAVQREIASSPTFTERKSTVVHGLRSGACAGAAFGVLWGIFLGAFGGLLGAAATNSVAGAGAGAVIVFALVFVAWLIEGVVVGAILGALDILCYKADAAKIGSYVGGAWAVLQLLRGEGSIGGVIWGGFWGAMLGVTASHIERVFFRKQNSDF